MWSPACCCLDLPTHTSRFRVLRLLLLSPLCFIRRLQGDGVASSQHPPSSACSAPGSAPPPIESLSPTTAELLARGAGSGSPVALLSGDRLQTEFARVSAENQLLKRAVMIQAGRLTGAESRYGDMSARLAEREASLDAAAEEISRLQGANYQLGYHLAQAEASLRSLMEDAGGGGSAFRRRGPGDGIA